MSSNSFKVIFLEVCSLYHIIIYVPVIQGAKQEIVVIVNHCGCQAALPPESRPSPDHDEIETDLICDEQ